MRFLIPRSPAGRNARARRAGMALAALVLAIAPALGQAPADAASPCQANVTGFLVTLSVWQPAPSSSAAASRACTPNAGATISGNWTVQIDAAVGLSDLTSFSVAITPADSFIPPLGSGATVSRTYPSTLLSGGKYARDSIAIPWDTTSLTPYNGAYTVTATAAALVGGTVNATVPNILVNNPPIAPGGVTAALNGTVPEISWVKNPEPDITGYQVLRSASGGPFVPVGSPTATTFRDTTAPQATPLSYEVIALRTSPLGPAGIASAPSASAALALPAPSPQPSPQPSPGGTPAPKTAKTTAPLPGANAAPTGPETTFAPTLPFAQAIPTVTGTALPALPGDPGSAQALTTASGSQGPTTGAQKLRFLVTAAFILMVSVLLVRQARRMIRGA